MEMSTESLYKKWKKLDSFSSFSPCEMKLPSGMTIINDDNSLYLSSSINDIAKKNQIELLNELTEEEATRREEICKTCTWHSTKHCIKRCKIELAKINLSDRWNFWVQDTILHKAHACDKYTMLLYGKCKKYMSIDQAEIQFDIEGV